MTHRKELLRSAIKATCGERDKEYGPPEINLQNTANFWNCYLLARFPYFDGELNPEDVAWMNNLQKVSRASSGPAGDDTYADAAAYSAIAGEVRE
jgi:hypothetical protein